MKRLVAASLVYAGLTLFSAELTDAGRPVLPHDTPVALSLRDRASSATARPGQRVEFTVADAGSVADAGQRSSWSPDDRPGSLRRHPRAYEQGRNEARQTRPLHRPS